MKKISVGSVHGRFQPLHNDHLEYLIESKKRCDFLWVGITQFNIKSLYNSPENPHRAEPSENPLTYFERVDMIKGVFKDAGVSRDEYDIIPFPLGDLQCLSDFLPTCIPVFTTICDEWNVFKLQLLEGYGYKVIVLWERNGELLKGVNIRSMIANDNTLWREQVPEATANLVDELNLRERLLDIKK